MFKLASFALFALVSSVPLTQAAAPFNAVFAGNYDGIATLKTVTGDSLYYSPLRFKINKVGVITGTAYNDRTKVLNKVTGKINKVTVQYGMIYTGKAAGKFADGTKWTAELNNVKGQSGKIISGNARKGAFTGTISLTNK